MAYSFGGATDWVEFATSPLHGTFSAFTVAAYFKRTTVGSADCFLQLTDTSFTLGEGKLRLMIWSDNKPYAYDGTNFQAGSQVLSSNSIWYLVVITRAAGTSVTPRAHVHDGTSWNHANLGGVTDSFSFSSGDRMRTGTGQGNAQPFGGDQVCLGIKKADSADATVETLSRTAWSAWTGFGFDWLIGFDSSLEAAGVLQDQATPGTGDETGISGTSAVSDPAGWSWSVGPPPSTFVPQIVIVS